MFFLSDQILQKYNTTLTCTDNLFNRFNFLLTFADIHFSLCKICTWFTNPHTERVFSVSKMNCVQYTTKVLTTQNLSKFTFAYIWFCIETYRKTKMFHSVWTFICVTMIVAHANHLIVALSLTKKHSYINGSEQFVFLIRKHK